MNFDIGSVLIVLGLVVVSVVILVTTIKNFLIVVPPNRVLVVSGRKTALENGDTVGYRVIRGGRAFRVPVLEQVNWMDLNTIPLELTVQNAFSKGGIPLTVHAVANVKVNAREPYLSNAIERFLNTTPAQLTQITKDTLEGNLRGIIATLTPEEINEDRLRFAAALIEEAEHDMHKIGMQLDTLKIQNVSDDAGYLISIGRKRTAEVLKDARIAEAERNAEAIQSEAVAQQRAQVAQVASQQTILEEQNKLAVRQVELEAEQKTRKSQVEYEAELGKVRAQQTYEQERLALEAELRRKKAETERDAKVAEVERQADAAEVEAQAKRRAQITQAQTQQAIAEEQNKLRVRQAELLSVATAKENEAQVAAEQARVIAAQQLEQERILLNQKKYEADIVAQARAQREAKLLEAQAAAAPIIEEGKAKAEAFRLMVEAFKEAGTDGEKAFVLNMLPAIIQQFADAVREVKIDKLSVIDSGNGQGFQSALHNMPRGIVSLLEQVESTTGVNLLSALQQKTANPETKSASETA
ncbi:flotillin family protein [Deinococcus misasensis]|uniref:flotillin family protein n=1 Tax=Deinococcus misasensis TaxID=392413 RepID=UPI000A7A9DE2|nr:SPFH domain-containing protein [Deinococcus misasensis]